MATVVEFVEPCARNPSKRSGPISSLGDDAGKPFKKPHLTAVRGESFEDMKRSVMELGASGKSRKERLKMEEQKLVRLGCAPRKQPKTPLPILKAMNIKHKKKDRARKLEAKEADIIAASSVGRKTKKKSA